MLKNLNTKTHAIKSRAQLAEKKAVWMSLSKKCCP